jgi:alpha-galactosidase
LRLIAQWREADSLYYGDFFPLTPYSLDTNAWIAWQFNQPEQGTGVIQAFRRQDSPFDSAQLKLRGLDPAAHYVVKNLDTSLESQFTGSQLMREGISVPIRTEPGAAVLLYRRKMQAMANRTGARPTESGH